MDKPKLNPQGFKGIVQLKDWWKWKDQKQYLGFYGNIFIYQDKEIVGFSVRGNDSNWIARIQGETMSVNILGCQVRGIIEDNELPSADSDFKVVP